MVRPFACVLLTGSVLFRLRTTSYSIPTSVLRQYNRVPVFRPVPPPHTNAPELKSISYVVVPVLVEQRLSNYFPAFYVNLELNLIRILKLHLPYSSVTRTILGPIIIILRKINVITLLSNLCQADSE